MNPDSSIDGRKKKNDICMAWSWFLATVEKVMPIARLATMNSEGRGEQQAEAADHRHVEQEPRGQQDQADLDVADEDVGDDLADQHLDRPRRHGEQVLHRAALALAGDRQRR